VTTNTSVWLSMLQSENGIMDLILLVPVHYMSYYL
jgi:hypothetical protein